MKEYEIDGWFRLTYPEHYEYSEEEDYVSFYSTEADAQGTLQISIYESEDSQEPKQSAMSELNTFLGEFPIDVKIAPSVTTETSDMTTAYASGIEDGMHLDVWSLTDGKRLLFLTYVADQVTDEKMEIESIIDSIEWT
ncbi:DUF3805 domain-containing protein [Exiguobacterium profundum]|uniref:DUF3805 domain-containing protein n=1 Tax=Exiguobacterium TaxID=33986 RepID=UPI00093D4785|nr:MULTISPECIES: DUF3805 domain-containing protein [Exiguobacterium]QPI67183.1 DUF3805 domain-containing protein [Exiguobacterium sp. PBE]MBG0918584.1 DUF3805 domain-containing protein [Exiguobacterium sp. SRB7LM]MBQ6459376.1 DUF3805 domain-containing protein [Exiguobacterium sp.]MBR2757689.1 DUF3805 domain-containing protein [Exiguobacterium sp.]MCT4798927.1 DUF3805 domain-containing protein [Exiguobacterium profundum]